MAAWQPIHDDDAGAKAYQLGTHRTRSPQETLERARPHLSDMGITRVANVTGLDDIGIPVVMVCRPNSRSVSVSQGKGVELAAAKASGVMEAVETYHAERITAPLKLASFEELEGDHPMADISGLSLCAAGRYRPDRAILWMESRDLMSGAPLWLPHELVHTDYTLPQPTGSGCFQANTNGLASGNHMLEAVAHGIYEVIERDALTLWHLQIPKPDGRALDLKSVDDDTCRDLVERFERAGIQVRVWDVTSDVGVAAFYCLIMGGRWEETEPEFGSGCHPDRRVALLRALTEAAQARTTFIAGSRDDFDAGIYSAAARAERARACGELMRAETGNRAFADVPGHDADTLRDDITWTLDRLRAVGVEQAAVVDLSQQRFGIPVVRVVVPGLEGVFKGAHGDYVPGSRARRLLERAP